MGGLVSKNWLWVNPQGERIIFQLHHHTLTGYRCVKVNGQEVYSGTKLFDDGDVINIDIGEDVTAKMVIAVLQLDFVYSMLIDDKELKEMISDSTASSAAKIKIIVPNYEIAMKDNKDVAYYNIHTTVDGNLYTVSKRFSQITEMHAKVYGAFTENHLQENLPDCPPKHFKFWTDHLAADFLDGRRIKIEDYLKKLIAVPKVQSLPDIRHFLIPEDSITASAATETATLSTTTPIYTASVEKKKGMLTKLTSSDPSSTNTTTTTTSTTEKKNVTTPTTASGELIQDNAAYDPDKPVEIGT